jgi:hypothetical protein
MRICFAARLIAIGVVLVMVQSSPGVENKTGIVCAFVRNVAAFPLPFYITIEVSKATGGAPNYRPPLRSRGDHNSVGPVYFPSVAKADASGARTAHCGRFDMKNRFRFRNGFSSSLQDSAASAKLATRIIGSGR